MYKCLECGNIFEDGEQAEWREDYGEKFSGCPICKGDFVEARNCKWCGDVFTEEELYDGLCEKCLLSAIDYDTFLEYLESDKNALLGFMFGTWWKSDIPEWASAELIGWLSESFRRFKANDILTNTHSFLDACVNYVMYEDGSFGRDDYAEWLNDRDNMKKEGKK